jgi:DNA-binding GntR family transcriptional regulator
MRMTEPFPEVSRQTLADRVYSQLRDSIINGRLADGTELNQVELAEQFGVSRVPVREALRRLQAENLVVANPYQRHVVRAVSPEDVVEMVELREELEVFALRKAMRRMRAGRSDAATSAEAALARQSVKLRGEQWLAADHEFHRQFHASPVVAALIDDLRQRVHRYFQVVVADTQRRSQVIDEHRALLDAIEADDEARAVALLRAHVGHTRELLAQHLGQDGDGDGEVTLFAGQPKRPAARRAARPSVKERGS